MSLYHSPYVVTDGLVLYLDAANPKSIKKRSSNLLSWDSWTIGSGSVTGYIINGTTAENRRILDTNPFGHSDVVWDTPSNDVESGADGGWDGSAINIDPTKMYRFSTWVRRKVLGNGNFYLGCQGFDSVGAYVGVLNRSNGTVDTNPYFSVEGWWGSANSWYLVVGHVWPVGSGTGTMHVDSSIYDTSGTKVALTTQDYVWQSTNVKTRHRSYLYYSTDPTTNQQWYHPRIDLCDGTEPTISELLGNIENTWYDLSGNGNNGILTNSPIYESSNNGRFSFLSTNAPTMVRCANKAILNINSSITLLTWIYRVSGTGMVFSNGTLYGLFSNGTYWYWSSVTSGWTSYSSSVTVPSNVWVQLGVTHTPGATTAPTFYINGISNTATGTTPTATNAGGGNTITIGEYSGYQPYNQFIGKVGLSQIYNRALSATEIQQNFNAHRGRYNV